jgi:hypothetical protein
MTYMEIIQKGKNGRMGTCAGYDSFERFINDCITLDINDEVYEVKFY